VTQENKLKGRLNLSTVAIPVAVPASYEFLNLSVTDLTL
jgi:hypothetical protein